MSKIKGIVLAGGLGTRLAPLTKEDNKHLLPIFNKRMIEYPVETLVKAGIDEIILITGGKRPGAFLELFKNGKDHSIKKIYYTYQIGNGGIPDALKLAEPFVENNPCVVILGDNYFEDGIAKQLQVWKKYKKYNGAGCFLQKTNTPWNFGIAETDQDNKIISIEEKPKQSNSSLAVLGCYFFDKEVWKILPTIKPSLREELEITDVLEVYMQNKNLDPYYYNGFWSDMGTFQNLTNVSQRIWRQSI